MKRIGTFLALFLTIMPAWHAARAQQVATDPTRPPAGILSPDTAGPVSGGSLLQSVMITPTQRAAIIGGEWVKLGDKYGDARVVRITESEVVLRSAAGAETLRMYPEVEVKPVESAGAARKAGKARKAAARNREKRE